MRDPNRLGTAAALLLPVLLPMLAACGASAPTAETSASYSGGNPQAGGYPQAQAAAPPAPPEPSDEEAPMADIPMGSPVIAVAPAAAPPPPQASPTKPAPRMGSPKESAPPSPVRAVARTDGDRRATGARTKPELKKAAEPSGAVEQARGIRAGEWDDNSNYRDFLSYIGHKDGLGIDRIDVSSRRFLVVRDVAGKGVPGCVVRVRDEAQHETQLTTTASGRAILFPRAMGLTGGALMARTECQGHAVQARFDSAKQDDAIILQLPKARASVGAPVVDIAFVLDTTGSMSEEIREVKETLRRVSDTLGARGVKVRIGLVEYKDKGDEFVTKTYPMTHDIASFSRTVSHIQASGGGDMPENANEGIEVALRDLTWSTQSVARLAFVIADAPPHLDYPDAQAYGASAKDASKRGIQIFTVATSGMDELGQAVFRQIAQFTGGTNMFVLRGGAGPQSTGAGDAESSCGGAHQNFQSGNLDQLITHKIAQELAAIDADPLRIAGLGQDERAKPCKDRVLVLAN